MRNPIAIVLAVLAVLFIVSKQRSAAQERARAVAVRDSAAVERRREAVADRRRYDSIMASRSSVTEMAAGVMRADSQMRRENEHRLDCMRKQAPIYASGGGEPRIIGYGDTAVDCRR